MTALGRIDLGGRTWLLDPAGALVDEGQGLLVISDLHLEAGSAYARRGVLLPPYDTMATLGRLELVMRRWRPRRVVSLGDAFHDRLGPASLTPAAFDRLRTAMGDARWIWIAGNHDRRPPPELGGAVADELDLGGLTLRHVPSARPSGPEVAGHLHPKGKVARRRLRLSRPCFVVDRERLIMPAFGAYTGGLNALDPAVTGLFEGGFDAWLLGERRIFRVPHGALEADARTGSAAVPARRGVRLACDPIDGRGAPLGSSSPTRLR